MSPSPSNASDNDDSHSSTDSGISSAGEDNCESDLPHVAGGIMKKLGHRLVMKSLMNKSSTADAAVHCTRATSISTTTNTMVVSVRF